MPRVVRGRGEQALGIAVALQHHRRLDRLAVLRIRDAERRVTTLSRSTIYLRKATRGEGLRCGVR